MRETILLSIVLLLSGCSTSNTTDSIVLEESQVISFETNLLIEVDGGDLSGSRLPNVVVDIGFGDRVYYGFTNEFGQLVKVTAEVILLQDEETEPVTSLGRYYPDEAKVPGTESTVLDEGHVIADSLGGVANAYNITPQNSTLNRYGDQAYMEKMIRDAGGCTNFEAVITYPNTTTQIPSHYRFTFTLLGEVIHLEFDNINPDEANEELITAQKEAGVWIKTLDKVAEYIILINNTDQSIDLSGWKIVSVTGSQEYMFDQYILLANEEVKVGDSNKNPDVDLHWLEGTGIWNNSNPDPAELYDESGTLIDRFER